jgi:hypothetical protein
MAEGTERAHFCPFCGEPVGSFFGRFGAGGETWCERCEDWFRAERCEEPNAGEGSDVVVSGESASAAPETATEKRT